MAEAPPQSFLDAYQGKEVLEEDKARVRSQILCFKSNIQCSPGFTSNLCFAMFHLGGLRFDWYVVFSNSNCTSLEATFRQLYAIVPTVPRCETRSVGGCLSMRLNLTGSELKPRTFFSTKCSIS